MAKPILVVRIPAQKIDNLKSTRRLISEGCNHEYHVFLIVKEDTEDKTLDFETHNAENLSPLDVKELARIVSEHNQCQTENI